jgi:cell shape-determining protein MreC
VASAKRLVQSLLRPGLASAETMIDLGGHGRIAVASYWSQATAIVQLEDRLRQEQARVRELEAALMTARLQASEQVFSHPGLAETTPLLGAKLVEARVLGRQARAFLSRHEWIDIGQSAGIGAGDWLLDAPVLVDQGAESGIESGQLVLVAQSRFQGLSGSSWPTLPTSASAAKPQTALLGSQGLLNSADDPHPGADGTQSVPATLAGRRVWGKVIESAAQTSSVLRLTESGYRDLVQLVQSQGDALKPGPCGMLEGAGERQCRIRMISATEPVSVGDLVVTTGQEGLAPQPLLYGKVVRAELPPGAAHWEIWMLPAIAGGLERVAVLTAAASDAAKDELAGRSGR